MARPLLPAFVLLVLASIVAGAQNKSGVPDRPTPPKIIEALQAPVKVPATPVLTEGTPILLRLSQTVKVKDAKPGDQVNLEVAADLWYRDTLLVQEGAAVSGEVQRVEMPKRRSRGSYLQIWVNSVRLVNGREVALHGHPKFEGGALISGFDMPGAAGPAAGLAAAGAGAVVGTIWLVKKGKIQDAPAGARFSAFVADDVPLDLEALRALPVNATRPAASAAHIHILRFGVGMFADVFCNGIPISKLPRNHRLDLDVPQGYYRFSVSAKKPVEMFVNAGEDYYLDWDFSGFAGGKLVPYQPDKRTVAELTLKPVEQVDYWNETTKCTPLPEEAAQP